MLAFLMIGANTLARPAAILDARPAQFDPEHDLFDLNPPGRKQIKKFRPIVPVTQTLRPWLERSVGDSDRYVSYRGKPIHSITHI
jgi:integrase